MIVSGKIHSIDLITKDITNVVLVKSRKKKQYFISILFYYHFSDFVKKEYLSDDFVKIWFRIRSNARISQDNKTRYYTDIIGDKIILVKRKGLSIKKMINQYGMEEKHKYYIEDTGEIISQNTVTSARNANPNREPI
tara:strand:+ start:1896 stop:2306 length:411 start_codon:yes stop_codon:yes gene_type:complete